MAGELLLLNISKLTLMVFKCITGNIIGIKILQKVKLTCILDAFDTCFAVAERDLIYESVQVSKEFNIPLHLFLCHIRLS
jgi:hypothetical protein